MKDDIDAVNESEEIIYQQKDSSNQDDIQEDN
jgi:hypothetical protein